MTLLYYDPVFLQHDTGEHPENAGRLRAVLEHLGTTALDAKCVRPDWQPATDQQLGRVHSANAIETIGKFVGRGGGRIEQDTVVSEKSLLAATTAAGAACDAVRRVVAGEDKTALCLVRPPGHHAMQNHPMGFCLFNNVAVGTAMAIEELGIERVMIVDWDVHHGNGTQATFWEDPRVGFLSMHRFPFYPGSGTAEETGEAAGKGWTVNLPIRFGTPRKDQIDRFRDAVESLADRLKPQLVMISAGFDSHINDPIGSLGLESEDFESLTNIVLTVANHHADSRVVSLLEGGYSPTALAESVQCHLSTLLGG